jgi:hypothetical protein
VSCLGLGLFLSKKLSMNTVKYFDDDVAKDVGTDAAIILHNIEFWQVKNKANKRNFYDGKYWTYNSLEAWGKLFPYLTTSKIRTCLSKLKGAGYVVTGNYNKSNYDRTTWYSSTRSISKNAQSHLLDLTNQSDNNDLPIPDNKPDNKPYNNIEKEKKKKDSLPLNKGKEEGAIHKIPEGHKQFKDDGSGQGMAEKLKLGEEVNELLNWWHSQISFRENENNVKYVISAMGDEFSVGDIKKLVNFMLSHSEKDSNGYKRHNIVPSSLSRDEDLIYKWAGEYKSVRGGSLSQTKTIDYDAQKRKINDQACREVHGISLDEYEANEEKERQEMLNREPDF